MAAPAQYVLQWPSTTTPADTSNNDEVRTIFVLGFPPDVKERELQNLLRWWPGYEASQMNLKADQPMGFALFSTAAMALAARDALQNLVFDPDANSVLRAEMAKKNLYVKRGVVGSPADTKPLVDPSKRLRTVGDYAPTYAATPATAYLPAGQPWAPQSYIAAPAYEPAAQTYDPYATYAVTPVTQVTHIANLAPAGYAPVRNTKDNPPCNTLFIGNLGENTSEAELRGLFSGQPGFRQMKVLRQGKSTVCFVEMQDIPSAMGVHQSLQGAVLTTSERGGMRIQYSKNPFGRKRDGMPATPQNAPREESQMALLADNAVLVPAVPVAGVQPPAVGGPSDQAGADGAHAS